MAAVTQTGAWGGGGVFKGVSNAHPKPWAGRMAVHWDSDATNHWPWPERLAYLDEEPCEDTRAQ